MEEKEDELKFELECSCGCGELEFSQWKDDRLSFISYNISAFSSAQIGRLDRVKTAFKVFWHLAVLDKEYTLYEIVIDSNEKLKKFKDFVSKMKEIE